jgi:hypothetical protein
VSPIWVSSAVAAAVLALSGCGGSDGGSGSDVCANADGALSDATFIIVEEPRSGERVSSGFAVRGCSRTFESNVPWTLVDAAGTQLASGFTMGGGVDGPGDFSFTVSYSVSERQIGLLEVSEEDVARGEGTRRPVRNVIPLVLRP